MGRAQKLIRTGDDPILRTVCAPAEPGENLVQLMADMELVCKKLKGVGLAAPQVGSDRRVIYLLTSGNGTIRGRFMVNPELLSASETTNIGAEGCLSYPGISKDIRRPDSVKVRYENERRQPREQDLHGLDARVFCHELDHLNGVCKVGDPEYPADELPEEVRRQTEITGRRNVQLFAAMLGVAAMSGMPSR